MNEEEKYCEQFKSEIMNFASHNNLKSLTIYAVKDHFKKISPHYLEIACKLLIFDKKLEIDKNSRRILTFNVLEFQKENLIPTKISMPVKELPKKKPTIEHSKICRVEKRKAMTVEQPKVLKCIPNRVDNQSLPKTETLIQNFQNDFVQQSYFIETSASPIHPLRGEWNESSDSSLYQALKQCIDNHGDEFSFEIFKSYFVDDEECHDAASILLGLKYLQDRNKIMIIEDQELIIVI